jgi:hypothetical protein
MEPPECVWDHMAVFAGVSPDQRVTIDTAEIHEARRLQPQHLPPLHAFSRCGIEPGDKMCDRNPRETFRHKTLFVTSARVSDVVFGRAVDRHRTHRQRPQQPRAAVSAGGPGP